MRLFLAIELSDAARDHLIRVQDAMRPVTGGVSWTRPSNLHLTLKFLGEFPDPQVPQLCDGLGTIPLGPMRLVATGIACFPDRGPIRIIGAKIEGLEDDSAALLTLVDRIEQACFDLGFGKEGRAYRPHVTLARCRSPLPPALRLRLADATKTLYPGPESDVRQFVLISSRLDPAGAQYTVAASFPAK